MCTWPREIERTLNFGRLVVHEKYSGPGRTQNMWEGSREVPRQSSFDAIVKNKRKYTDSKWKKEFFRILYAPFFFPLPLYRERRFKNIVPECTVVEREDVSSWRENISLWKKNMSLWRAKRRGFVEGQKTSILLLTWLCYWLGEIFHPYHVLIEKLRKTISKIIYIRFASSKHNN